MNYGMPYMGSKSKIAQWIVDILPPSDTLVDLFAGGCAVTHCAMLSDKWKHFIANDISGTSLIFRDAIKGEYKDFSTVLSHSEFFATNDVALKILYSFGNCQRTYIYSEKNENVKTYASKMITAPSVHERRMYYTKFMKELRAFLEEYNIDRGQIELQGLEHLERLQGLEHLERLQRLQGRGQLEVTMSDYKLVNVPKGSTVYADPPYRDVFGKYGSFDYDAFDTWLNEVDFPVFISEYTAPKGCVCIAEKQQRRKMAPNNCSEITEKIFVQERFKDIWN